MSDTPVLPEPITLRQWLGALCVSPGMLFAAEYGLVRLVQALEIDFLLQWIPH